MLPITSEDKYKEVAKSTGFVISQWRNVRKDYIFKDVETLIKSYMIHFKFDASHFNTEALENKFGKGESNLMNKFYIAF